MSNHADYPRHADSLRNDEQADKLAASGVDPRYLMNCVRRWLFLRSAYDRRFQEMTYPVHQLHSDIDHSSLLARLFSGVEPSPYPPSGSHIEKENS